MNLSVKKKKKKLTWELSLLKKQLPINLHVAQKLKGFSLEWAKDVVNYNPC